MADNDLLICGTRRWTWSLCAGDMDESDVAVSELSDYSHRMRFGSPRATPFHYPLRLILLNYF